MIIFISSNIKKHYRTYIDFLDYNWIKYLEKKNHNFYLIPNSIKNFILMSKNLKPNLIILTGGNDIFKKNSYIKNRLKVEKKIISYAISKKIPILGICRGAQLLNLFFGGKIRKIKNHMRTRHNIFLEKKTLFKKNKLEVNSFHNHGISSKDLSKKLKVLARDKNKNIELYCHKSKKIIGVMWHPEREKNNLIDLIFKKVLK